MAKQQERCALCKAETNVDIDTPTYKRTNYIDNAGQLCEDCYSVISANKVWHNLL